MVSIMHSIGHFVCVFGGINSFLFSVSLNRTIRIVWRSKLARLGIRKHVRPRDLRDELILLYCKQSYMYVLLFFCHYTCTHVTVIHCNNRICISSAYIYIYQYSKNTSADRK